MRPAKGRTLKWKLLVRGDRKLLKLLVPRLRELLPIDIHAPQQTPLWHCPVCGNATESHPKVCAQCETQFKTSKNLELIEPQVEESLRNATWIPLD